MYFIAHRGWTRSHPDNTLAAFAAAWAAGMAGFETDIRVDRDGQAILFHDRTAANGALVSELSQQELSEIQGYAVPSLADALAAFPQAFWNLELKSADSLPATRTVLANLAQPFHGLISSFHHPLILTLARETRLPCALLLANAPVRTIGLFTMLATVPRAVGLVFDYEIASAAQISELSRNQVPCWLYGVQHPSEYAAVLGWPLAGLISDQTEQLPGLSPRPA
ncbi:glycerophosphodiester phosphodiesterase [Chitinibacter tainanensis]|uniref:glycerophosphodiester phosphodiesterase n=1 Tax=Chitinibacter tainanensis TaxID=230667 RepID=UPI0023557381|nr:glycerophosphodiester phosphodiesterase [Chitinibacter tainanensis]